MYNSNWKEENEERGREAKNKKIKEQKGSTQAIKWLPGFGEQHRVQEQNATSSTVWGKSRKSMG